MICASHTVRRKYLRMHWHSIRDLCCWVLFMAGGFAWWPTQDRGERRDRCWIFDPRWKSISDS
jgi:hypothetical protein